MYQQGRALLLDDLELARGIFGRITSDLGIILDRDVGFDDVRVDRTTTRVAGTGGVHISFRLGVLAEGRQRQGALLVPLPEAISLAGYMMMLADEEVARERARTELDGPFKESLLEIGKFLAGACDKILRRLVPGETETRSEGCQGVRPGVRPVFAHIDGEELIVARARMRVHSFEHSEAVLMLPALL